MGKNKEFSCQRKKRRAQNASYNFNLQKQDTKPHVWDCIIKTVLFSEKKSMMYIHIIIKQLYVFDPISRKRTFSLSKNLCIHINIKTKIYFAMHLSKNHCISIYQLILWLDNKLKDIF